MSRSWWWRAAALLVRHPELWLTAVGQVVRLAPTGWWQRSPFLPVPDAAYLRFRMVTAYGDPERSPEPADVITYLHWCRAWPRVTH